MNKRTYILLAGVLLLLLLGAIGMILLTGSSSGFLILVLPALFVGLFAWVVPISLKRANARVWIITGLIILLGLLLPTSALMSDYEAGPLSTLTGAVLFFLPSLALIDAAFLLFSGLNRTAPDRTNYRPGMFSLFLSALLIVKTLHNLYDLTLWDNTHDPLGCLWLIVPIFSVLVSSLALSISLTDWAKLAGPLYSIFISILLIAISALAQRVDFRQETTKRAERNVQAIESYYAREGEYPGSLSQLNRWYAIPLPKPMIIHGQDWCYQSGDDYYRLGYIDREHWSNPNLIGRVYKSVGDVPGGELICMTEFTDLQSGQPDYPYSYSMEDH